MGQAKAEHMHHLGLIEMAKEIGLETGALKACRLHSDVIMTSYDSEAERMTYAVATNRVKCGDIRATREQMMAAVKGALDDAAIDCGRCAKLEKE